MIVPSAERPLRRRACRRRSRGRTSRGPGTREFCAECGTHLTTRSPRDPNIVILKVGTLDNPATDYGGPQAVIWTKDAQPYHLMPEGVPQFPAFPGR